MIGKLRLILTTTLVLGAIIVGCQSMYDDGNAGSGAIVTPTPTPSGITTNTASTIANDVVAGGFFPVDSHEVDGGGPPRLESEENIEEGEETQSHFRAIQVDPAFEDTAGAKFLLAVDIDQDGLMDLVSGHNQSQPVQLHLQERDNEGKVRFRAHTLGGTAPIGTMAGLEVADMDQDGALDIVVLVKHTGELALCLDGSANDEAYTGLILILFSPPPGEDITNGDLWEQVIIEDSYSAYDTRYGRPADSFRPIDMPEDGGYTSLAVGDLDGVNGPDIVVTSNVEEPDCNTGENVVAVWFNPGANVRVGTTQGFGEDNPPTLAAPPAYWYPVWIDVDAPWVRDCAIYDVDDDGDLDVVSAYSNAASRNVRWYRNPLAESGLASVTAGNFRNNNRAIFASNWEERPIGTIDADIGAITVADMDNDGFDDLFVRSFSGTFSGWLRRPTTNGATTQDPAFPQDDEAGAGDQTTNPTRFNFPWDVYAMDDYAPYRPIGLAVGDLTKDGRNDAVVSVGGAIYWYDSSTALSVNDMWSRDFVLDDTKENGTTDDPTDLDFANDGTIIYTMVVADIDGDGANDIVGVFDRRVDSGLADDTIIWFRNTLFDEVDDGNTSGNQAE